jgi:hypothetical protein
MDRRLALIFVYFFKFLLPFAFSVPLNYGMLIKKPSKGKIKTYLSKILFFEYFISLRISDISTKSDQKIATMATPNVHSFNY